MRAILLFLPDCHPQATADNPSERAHFVWYTAAIATAPFPLATPRCTDATHGRTIPWVVELAGWEPGRWDERPDQTAVPPAAGGTGQTRNSNVAPEPLLQATAPAVCVA